MTRRIFLIFAFLILVCVFFSGCTTGSGTPAPVTTVPTSLPAVKPTTAPVVVTPSTTMPTIEPIQKLPPERQVNLVLTKDRPTSEIHLLYQGGPGDILVTRVIMRVYSSDGVRREFLMSNGKKPIAGDEIIAPGTRGGDQCEVFVISAGTRYKVMNESVYGGMYY